MLVSTLLILLVPQIALPYTCPYGGTVPGLRSFGQKCLVELFYGTLDEAINACSQMSNGTLPFLHNKDQQKEIDLTLTSSYGKDLTKYPGINTAVWLPWKRGWIDGSSSTYINTQINGSHPFLVQNRNLNGLGTIEQPSTTYASTICIYNPLSASLCRSEEEVGFSKVNPTYFTKKKKCYTGGTTPATFKQNVCSLFWFIATISSYQENEFIYNTMKLLKTDDNYYGWLNYMSEYSENTTLWMDGTPMNYTNFCKEGEPNCEVQSEATQCLAMILEGSSGGRWTFRNCTECLQTICTHPTSFT